MVLPVPADFAPPPDAATRARWRDAERSHLPGRLERLRARMAAEGVEAYFGVRREHMRWLTGFTLADGEEKVAGHSGQLLVGPEDVVLVTDSRYTIQARREAPDAVVDEIGYDLAALLAAAPGAGGGPARGRGGHRGLRTRCGSGWPPRRRTWSSSRPTAGSRRCGPSRPPTRSSGSPRPAPWPIGRWRPCCRRSGPESRSTTWPCASSG